MPVSAVTVPPHGHATWVAVVIFAVDKPGTYHFGRIRLTYTAGGARHWQYQSLSYSIRYSAPRAHHTVRAHGPQAPT